VNPSRIELPKEDDVRREIRCKRVLTFLLGLPIDKAWEIVVKPGGRKRSESQNAYLWSIYEFILERGGEELAGWTKDDLHDFFLIEHFGGETHTLFGRKRIKPLKRSSKLNKQEFTDFLECIMRFMAQRGVYIPTPEEDWSDVEAA